jgi:glycosyltransferase involved in cell wall biosynthesis
MNPPRTPRGTGRKERPLVTVVVSNYNYGRFLPRAIEAVRSQSYASIQLIVVDDGSTDGSREALQPVTDPSERIYQENQGQAAAMNAGVASARGEFLCLLDADDWWRESKVARVVVAFKTTTAHDIAMLRHSVLLHDGENLLLDQPITFASGIVSPLTSERLLTHRWHVPTSALSLTRNAAEAIFPLPVENLRISADAAVYTLGRYRFWAKSLNEVLGYYRVHEANGYQAASDSLEKRVRTEQELIRICRDRGWEPRIRFDVYRDTRRLRHLDVARILERPLRRRLADCWLTPSSPAGRVRHTVAEAAAFLA